MDVTHWHSRVDRERKRLAWRVQAFTRGRVWYTLDARPGGADPSRVSTLETTRERYGGEVHVRAPRRRRR